MQLENFSGRQIEVAMMVQLPYLQVEFPTFGKCDRTCLCWDQCRRPMGISSPTLVCKKAGTCKPSSFQKLSNVASFSVAAMTLPHQPQQQMNKPGKWKVQLLPLRTS